MWKWLKEDLEAMRSLQGIKIYYDKKRQIFASEVKNKPNKYVPTTHRVFINEDINIIESTNDTPTLFEAMFSKKSLLPKKGVDFGELESSKH